MEVCKTCHHIGEGKYCSFCGEIFQPARITIHSVLHEVLHTFTHADKGFLFTLKNLALHPGTMQRNYLAGERKNVQKPFSLFFICASVTAIILHFVNGAPSENFSHYDVVKEHFYKSYYVILQCLMLPAYAFITWIIFKNKKLNYAEALVLMIYTLSISLLIVIPINFTGLIPGFEGEQIVEVIFLGGYMVITNLRFFFGQNKWLIIFKSMVVLVLCYLFSNLMANAVINLML
ncbi:MAG: DUF3667 domain-containing protein [Ginsengibacter sp.]